MWVLGISCTQAAHNMTKMITPSTLVSIKH
jgi:hypothetical protein